MIVKLEVFDIYWSFEQFQRRMCLSDNFIKEVFEEFAGRKYETSTDAKNEIIGLYGLRNAIVILMDKAEGRYVVREEKDEDGGNYVVVYGVKGEYIDRI